MTVPPPPSPDEAQRQASLERLNVLNTPIESRYDRLTRAAKAAMGMMSCAISLVDDEREWYKSIQGSDASECGRNVSFCGHAILQNDVFVVEDTHLDSRFRDNPQVTQPPHVRFYAGAPIRDEDGRAIGMFCVKDDRPRSFSVQDRQALRDHAAAAGDSIMLHDQGGIEAQVVASLGKHRVQEFIDPATRLWNRQGVTHIANQIVNADDAARLNNMTIGCGVVLIRCASGDDAVMAPAARRLIDEVRDLDVAGRLADDSFLVLLSGCRSLAAANRLTGAILDRMVEPASTDLDVPLPVRALPVRGAASFLPLELGASLDEAIVAANRALRTEPLTRAAA